MPTIEERIDRLFSRIIDLPDIDRTTIMILRSYLGRDRSKTLRDIALARLRNLAGPIVYDADQSFDVAGWGLLLIMHSLPEQSDIFPLLLSWAEESISDPSPTTVFAFVWQEKEAS